MIIIDTCITIRYTTWTISRWSQIICRRARSTLKCACTIKAASNNGTWSAYGIISSRNTGISIEIIIGIATGTISKCSAIITISKS